MYPDLPYKLCFLSLLYLYWSFVHLDREYVELPTISTFLFCLVSSTVSTIRATAVLFGAHPQVVNVPRALWPLAATSPLSCFVLSVCILPHHRISRSKLVPFVSAISLHLHYMIFPSLFAFYNHFVLGVSWVQDPAGFRGVHLSDWYIILFPACNQSSVKYLFPFSFSSLSPPGWRVT